MASSDISCARASGSANKNSRLKTKNSCDEGKRLSVAEQRATFPPSADVPHPRYLDHLAAL